jgi:hypothetical protein
MASLAARRGSVLGMSTLAYTDLMGVRSSAFMLLFVFTGISVLWLHVGERVRRKRSIEAPVAPLAEVQS